MFLFMVKDAFADLSYINAYTVNEIGSEVPKTVFNYDEKPWLFLQIPHVMFDWKVSVSTWSWDGMASYTLNPGDDVVFDGGEKIWMAFSDQRWNDFKEEGEWVVSPVSILFEGFTPTFVTGTTTCTVTPEPVSCALFLLGGGALFTFGKRRKR